MARHRKQRAAADPCRDCDSHCCRYIAVQIAAPRHREEYEMIRWYLAHGEVCVYIDPDGDWLVQIPTVCRHLVGRRCAIYPARPKVCREYETQTCEQAESGGPENIAEFRNEEEFERFFRMNYRCEGVRVRRRHRVYLIPAPARTESTAPGRAPELRKPEALGGRGR
jgi:Fe-S-cluster containining protein